MVPWCQSAHERATPNAERRWTEAVTDHDQQGHDAVIGLIERGDTEGAGALWRAHLVGSAAHVLGGLGPSTVVSVLGPDGLGPGRNR